MSFLPRFLVAIALMGIGVEMSAATLRRPIERVASMDPIRAAAVYDAASVTLVYEPLLDVDYYARPYKLRPGLCGMPKVSAFLNS